MKIDLLRGQTHDFLQRQPRQNLRRTCNIAASDYALRHPTVTHFFHAAAVQEMRALQQYRKFPKAITYWYTGLAIKMTYDGSFSAQQRMAASEGFKLFTLAVEIYLDYFKSWRRWRHRRSVGQLCVVTYNTYICTYDILPTYWCGCPRKCHCVRCRFLLPLLGNLFQKWLSDILFSLRFI